MPFRRRGRYYYKDGRRYTHAQVKAYYATHGFKRRPRKRH